MSDVRDSSSPGAQRRHNLEQKKKLAKDLLRAFRRGDDKARGRVREFLPRLSDPDGRTSSAGKPLVLAEAQYVIARESGFASWPRMKSALEAAAMDEQSRMRRLIEAALQGRRAQVEELLAADHGTSPDRSIHAAAALGDDEAVARLLRERPELAVEEGGPRGWATIFYACHSRFGRLDSEVAQRRIRIVKNLLEKGADPARTVEAPDVPDGFRSVLTAAVECVSSPELVELLLEAGAKRQENWALWAAAELTDAVGGDDLQCLRVLLRDHPPQYQLDFALSLRVAMDEPRGVKLLLDAGASPDAGSWGAHGSVLHQAIRDRRSLAVIELLLEAGADLERPNRDGYRPYQIAVRLGRKDVAELLVKRGARQEVSEVDRVLADSLRGEASPDAGQLAGLSRTDHQVLAWALSHGCGEAVPALLRAGLDPEVADDEGDRPLHLAARAGDSHALNSLLGAGANPASRNHAGRTALDLALEIEDSELRRGLVERLLQAGSPVSGLQAFPSGDARLDARLRRLGAVEQEVSAQWFERARDAAVQGQADKLRRMLRDDPTLIHARSPRPHRATLLHYMAANGVETEVQRTPQNALEILRMLLDAGAEVDALCNAYGGGPAQTTLALLSSSSWPAEAGLQGDMVRMLVEAGANPNGLDEDGVPLATAIAFRCPQALDALVQCGARLDNLIFAAAAGHLEAVKQQVDPEGALRPQAGFCRVPWCRSLGDPVKAVQQGLIYAAQFGRLSTVRYLAEAGVDVNAAPVDGIAALHEASFMGHIEVVRYLLEKGADPTRRERRHQASALGWAREGKRQDILQLLLEHCQPDIFDAVEFNLPDRVSELLDSDPDLIHAPDGRAIPLRSAARRGRLEIVRILLSHGADPLLNPDNRGSALDLAKKAGHDEIARLLESRIG
ncbi:MAG TPA: ankyrin repeat domain-containing protein [Acidobacteriota bacterium]|nr:ankyrin repeat domain-containing protein [Acidobacteriota bacterium]